MKITEEQIKYLLGRATAEVISYQELSDKLRDGKKLRLKEGFDPSFPDIHLGHMVALRKLRQFQDLGHHVVLIVGDWTARIGDPSGARVTRPMLSAEQVKVNALTYMEQFFTIVNKEKTEVRWQSEWFDSFHLNDIINLTSKFTIAQMLAREDFNNRYNEQKPITITEFLYPLLQAYDSVSIKADVEFGGTDQKFNLLLGRELQKINDQPPQQVFLVPILTGTDGTKKMSKSLGNYIGVAEPPDTIFGKVMSIPDNLLFGYYKLLTNVPDAELDAIEQALEDGTAHPMELKKRLAGEIIIQLYDESAATEAASHFRQVVQNKETPEDIPSYSCNLNQKIDLRELIVAAGLAKSRGEVTRLINQGAVSIDGARVTEFQAIVNNGCVIKVGKRRFAKLIDSDIL